MTVQAITEAVLIGISHNQPRMKKEGIVLDQSFLAELGQALHDQALVEGLGPEAATTLRRAATSSVALHLGL